MYAEHANTIGATGQTKAIQTSTAEMRTAIPTDTIRCILTDAKIMRTRMNSGCKDCQERQPGCHTICEKYSMYIRELEDRKDAIRKGKKKYSEWESYNARVKRKMAKRKNSK